MSSYFLSLESNLQRAISLVRTIRVADSSDTIPFGNTELITGTDEFTIPLFVDEAINELELNRVARIVYVPERYPFA